MASTLIGMLYKRGLLLKHRIVILYNFVNHQIDGNNRYTNLI